MSKSASSSDSIRTYYDKRVEGKLRDFTNPNPRIEAAVRLIAEWAPNPPKRVLEIGCGVGHTSWRMARAWPDAQVIGSDLSIRSIEVARACFKLPNLVYHNGPLAEAIDEGQFDLVVMTDVYEHIALSDRPALHHAIRELLASDARFVLTVPTPALQRDARNRDPSLIQPVDEDISVSDITDLAKAVDARLVYYREVGIWNYGDYFHAVLARTKPLVPVALRQPTVGGLRARLKRFLQNIRGQLNPFRDELGLDVLRPKPLDMASKFNVSIAERKRLASKWYDII